MKKTTQRVLALAVLMALTGTASQAWAWGLTFKTDLSKKDNRRYDQSNRQRVGGSAYQNSNNRTTLNRNDNRVYDSSDNSVRIDNSQDNRRTNSHNVSGTMDSNNRNNSHNLYGNVSNSVLGNVDTKTSAGSMTTGAISGNNNYMGHNVANSFNLGNTTVSGVGQ